MFAVGVWCDILSDKKKNTHSGVPLVPTLAVWEHAQSVFKGPAQHPGTNHSLQRHFEVPPLALLTSRPSLIDFLQKLNTEKLNLAGLLFM